MLTASASLITYTIRSSSLVIFFQLVEGATPRLAQFLFSIFIPDVFKAHSHFTFGEHVKSYVVLQATNTYS